MQGERHDLGITILPGGQRIVQTLFPETEARAFDAVVGVVDLAFERVQPEAHHDFEAQGVLRVSGRSRFVGEIHQQRLDVAVGVVGVCTRTEI